MLGTRLYFDRMASFGAVCPFYSGNGTRATSTSTSVPPCSLEPLGLLFSPCCQEALPESASQDNDASRLLLSLPLSTRPLVAGYSPSDQSALCAMPRTKLSMSSGVTMSCLTSSTTGGSVITFLRTFERLSIYASFHQLCQYRYQQANCSCLLLCVPRIL